MCIRDRVVTPYGNKINFMHEGASGGGKSEMHEHIHRGHDGRILLGKNVVSGDSMFLTLPRGCDPVSYTHLRAHATVLELVCRLLLEKKKT